MSLIISFKLFSNTVFHYYVWWKLLIFLRPSGCEIMLSFSVGLRIPQHILKKVLEKTGSDGEKAWKTRTSSLSPADFAASSPIPKMAALNVPWSSSFLFQPGLHMASSFIAYCSKLTREPVGVSPRWDYQVEEGKGCISFIFLSLKCMEHGRSSTRTN